jgi:acyl carrier protein
MNNIEKYNQAFIKSFSITEEQLNSGLTYQSISIWDSVGHMELMATLEDDFDIMLETDDIVDFSSYDHGKEILKKYGIVF